MATRQRWETFTIQADASDINGIHLVVRFVNGVEVKDWEKDTPYAFMTRLGAYGGKCRVRLAWVLPSASVFQASYTLENLTE